MALVLKGSNGCVLMYSIVFSYTKIILAARKYLFEQLKEQYLYFVFRSLPLFGVV